MSFLRTITLTTTLALTAACSQPMVKPALAADPAPPAESTPPVVASTAPVIDPNWPVQALTPEWLFQFLVAEVAGQRGAIGVAKTTYLDLARQTRDPRVAKRAAEIAMFSRDQAAALESARLWAGSEPESERAQQMLAALLLNQGLLLEAEPVLQKVLATDTANGFLHLAALMGKTPASPDAYALVQRLAATYPALPEAQFAIAQAAMQVNRPDDALAAVRQADALRPGWEPAALYHAQLLAKNSRSDALAFLRDFLARYPESREVRLTYARLLVNANQFDEARSQFTRLTTDFPRNAEVSFAAGLLSLQMGDVATARGLLQQTLEYQPKDAGTVYYYLGQTEEEAKQTDAALAHYARVEGGNYLVSARVRQAALLTRAGKPDEARALLAATQGDNEAQNIKLVQAQAELLREAKSYAVAYDVLSAGLKRFPDAADLLYDRAMVAEKLNKLDVLEADLRRAIELRPNDAQAYNALGYTLADRTTRQDEAIKLLDKALSLAPEDAFIIDSMGWAQFRAGNFARAQEHLERAYKIRPDPEIAAHLGEVLWARGQRAEAGQLWQTSLQSHPQNEVLLETLRRLKP
ncbi:MAG: tetratricopeptide repeat protein [Thiobacillus sp.]